MSHSQPKRSPRRQARLKQRQQQGRRRPTLPADTNMTWTADSPETGEKFTLNRWQIASTVTLNALWAQDGVLVLPGKAWDLARRDVATKADWGLMPEVDKAASRMRISLRDTTTSHTGLLIPDLVLGNGGRGLGTLSGDPVIDTHLAIMLTILRISGGMLEGGARQFWICGEAVIKNHPWHVRGERPSPHEQVFTLSEPEGSWLEGR
jgi:hypothetical protein